MKQSSRKGIWKRLSILLLSSLLVLGNIATGSTLVQAAEQKSEKILSEQEAIEYAKKWVTIPEGYEYSHGKYYEPYEDYIPYAGWSLNWNKSDQSSIMYVIHPVSGNLLRYQYHGNDSEAPSPATTNRQQIALEGVMQFLTKVIPPEERAKLTLLEEGDYKSNNPETYSFKFQRVENGIPFKDNSIAVTVRGDGKILRFNRLWYEGELPDASQIISEKEARELLEQKTEPTMYYKSFSSGDHEEKYKLVYDYLPTDPQMVDAISGVMIDGKGAVAKPKQPIKILKELPPASAPKAGSQKDGAFTREQAEAGAIHLLQTTLRDQLADIYMLDPQPYDGGLRGKETNWRDYKVHFGWLKNGLLIENARFEVSVNPYSGSSHIGDDERPYPVILDNNMQRVDLAFAKKTEQAVKKSLELYYLLPNKNFNEVEEPKPRLVYRLSGDKGVVDAHTGKWISFSQPEERK
ncbi:YcdB/YcdC domain-containing protein [Brevibacillus sp. 179-C 1.1 NHS]|uniref:YcdB/YcdC domain-containing protein n=1 Tax=Brevibacillus sp. 179-C 1.1 NHS TaxID=3235177 RepID=UPI0039A08398